MTSATTASIRDEWTRLSAGWETKRSYLLEMSRPVHLWLVEALAPTPGEAILEIGAGAGDTGFLAAASLGPNGRLVSTDLSDAMVEIARRRAQELGISNVMFQSVDAQVMPFADASFDAVVSRWCFMLMPDPAQALSETRRVLRPGGRLALSVFTGPADNPWAAHPARLLMERGRSAPPEAGAPGILALGDRQRLGDLLEAAQFTDIVIDSVPFAWRFPNFEDYWTFLIDITALSAALQKLGDADRETFRAQLVERLAPYREGDGLDLPACCWMVRARS